MPQSKHPHFLLNSGRRAIGEIFPGFEEALIAAGGMHLMPSMDAAYCEDEGWAPRKSGSMTMVYSSRVLIERVLRDLVRGFPTIEIREGVTVTGLRSSGVGTARGRVEESSTVPATTRATSPQTWSSTRWGAAPRWATG